MTIKITALVPMKEHSSRVPNKNIRDFCERPLFYMILYTLLKVKYIDTIVVNTDSKTINELIKKDYPAIIIIDRPYSLCGDYVSMNKIINYDISRIEGEYFLQTHSTNPLLKASTLQRAIKKYLTVLAENYDSLFSVTEHRVRCYDKDRNPINHNPRKLIRTQDLSPIYEENSNFYIFSRNSFKKNNNRIGIRPYLYKMNKIEAIDIDNKEDFKLAELIFKFRILDKNI